MNKVERTAQVFEYLDDLRDSGATNMWGAASYVEKNFLCSEGTAIKLTGAWMDSIDGELSAMDRALSVIERIELKDDDLNFLEATSIINNPAMFYLFKSSGKYYTEGLGNTPRTNEVWSREQLLAVNGGKMPGLSGDGNYFKVLIIPTDAAEFGWPQIKEIEPEHLH